MADTYPLGDFTLWSMGLYRDLMGFIVNQWDINGIYPLVNIQIAIENGH
jgi:hypothetical protein